MSNEYRPAIILLIIAVIASAILSFTYVQTKSRIDRNVAEKIATIQKRVLPGADEYNEKQLGSLTYYEAITDGSLTGRVLLVRPSGYGGPIDLLVGIKAGKVSGVEVLQMKETPGFGDKVSTPKFIKQFLGKSADDPVAIREDIDAVTGATITSKAFINGVREALDRNRDLEAGSTSK